MILPTINLEKNLWKQGFSSVCGIDEVGRGAFAGPLVVCAAIFPRNCIPIIGVADSKLLTPLTRKTLSRELLRCATAVGYGSANPQYIDSYGISTATQYAIRCAINSLPMIPDYYLIDAFKIKDVTESQQHAIIKGDQTVYSIAAASILAKVYRDELMVKLHDEFAAYRWNSNKGYGTADHRKAIRLHGLTEHHRKSFIHEGI